MASKTLAVLASQFEPLPFLRRTVGADAVPAETLKSSVSTRRADNPL